MNQPVKSLTAVSPVYPDGQKIDTVVIEYERETDSTRAEGPQADAYEVTGRRIVRVYTNDASQRSQAPKRGRYCILELDPREEAAAVMQLEPLEFDEPGPHFHPDGSPVLPQAYRRPVREHVIQTREIAAADGSPIPVWEADTDQALQPVIDDFIQGQYEDIPYSLYIPQTKKNAGFPLVVFLHDAGPNGSDPLLTLSQGNAPTAFAAPRDQALHPAFVLAPQIPKEVHLTTDNNTCAPQIETVKSLIDRIVSDYPVDPDRIYWAGQSQGTMAGFELARRYPGYFAAFLLAAGQWDAQAVGKACVCETFWMLSSDGDLKANGGMCEIADALERNGARVGRYHWNAKWPREQLELSVRAAAADDFRIRHVTFTDHSVIPDGADDNPGADHMATWPVVYAIDALRDWLFTQKRGL